MSNLLNRRKSNGLTANMIIRLAAAAMVAVLLIIICVGRFDQIPTTAIDASVFILSVIGAIALILLVVNPLIVRKDGTDLTESLYQISKAIVVCDRDGKVSYCNKTYLRLTGGAAVGPIEYLARHHDLSEMVYRLRQANLGAQPFHEELRAPYSSSPFQALGNADHSDQWVNITLEPLGGCNQILWIIEDNTLFRIKQEESLRTLEGTIKHFDQAPIGIFGVDRQKKIIFMNATLSTKLGIEVAKCDDYALSRVIADDDLPVIDKILSSQGQLAQPQRVRLKTSHNNSFDTLLFFNIEQLPNGNKLARFAVVPIQADGYDQGYINVLLENFPVAIALLDENGRITMTNDNFSSLLDPEGENGGVLNGKELHTLIRERDRETLIHGVSRSGRKNHQVVETTASASPEKHLRLYLTPFIPSGPHQHWAYTVVAIETTMQKALEEQMAESQKMQAVGQLAGGIAHDFNNVLTAIIMSCDILLSNHRNSDPSHPDLINIKNNANRAASLVQQLLAFSRRQTLNPEIIDLTDLISDIRMLLLRLLGQNISLQVAHGRDLWKVEVDEASLQRVIMNLAINARDAMPDGGQITITTRNIDEQTVRQSGYSGLEIGEYVELSIADTGTGIPLDVQKKMFEPFFTTKEVGKGTGLGLSMVYGIIRQTGGFIFFDSELGEGTTFRIYLPRYQLTNPVKQNDAPESSLNRENGKTLTDRSDLSGTATILVVEDEDAVRTGSVRALTVRGYRVLEASSGLQALEVLQEHQGKVDLVISDVVMPEMDGPALYKEMRKTYPNIKFIFVSGYARDAFAAKLTENDDYGFLAKPFSLKALASTVKAMLSASS